MIIQKRMNNGQARSENFNNQTSTQSCLESMENQLSSSDYIFPRFTSIEILWKNQEDLEARQINPEQLEGRILFIVHVQRHG